MKIIVFCVLALPAGRLAWLFATGDLGPLPYANILVETGEWSMRLLVAGLAITPLRGLLAWPGLIRLRRMVGLFAALYAFLHVLAYAADWSFHWGYILGEIVARTYLTAGAFAVLALVPLALTANNMSMRWLGGKRWRQIHNMTYTLTVVALVHFILSGRQDQGEPLILAGFLGWAFSYRLLVRRRKRSVSSGTPSVGQQFLLGSIWTLLTFCLDLAYIQFATAFEVSAIFRADITPEAGIRPAIWVGVTAAILTIAQLVRQRLSGPAALPVG
ncbi:MAG: sulfite oxidase heme-binding subunit YedZ [Alphaproteobacteria bacterium]